LVSATPFWNLHSRFGRFVSALKIPFPGNGDFGSRAEFPNQKHLLWPGQLVNARLLLDTRHDGLTVPASVVQQGPQGAYAYELKNYLRESYRLLRAGGAMMQPHSNIEHPPATYGTRHTFQHRMGDALIESEAQPQAAVASHTDFLFGLCRKRGNDGFACNKHPAFRRGRRYFVPLLTAHTAIKFFDLA
jgi:hypothetical protein